MVDMEMILFLLEWEILQYMVMKGYDKIDRGQDKSIIDGGPGFDICNNARIAYNCEQ
jgi:hypothetical protein